MAKIVSMRTDIRYIADISVDISEISNTGCGGIKPINLRLGLRLEDPYTGVRNKKKMAQLRGTDVELHPSKHVCDV